MADSYSPNAVAAEFKVAVAIATYQRPDGLAELLESLQAQRGVDREFGIIVVDNDPEGSARSVVDAFASSRFPLIYEIESDPGIPAARNRGIAIARRLAASIVAFIDDDEFASPYWLATMVRRLVATGADAVSGPVEPIFQDGSPDWAYRSRLYHRATFPDGAELDYASTANSFLRLEAIAGNLAPFRPDFRYSGGSDTFLFHSLRTAGKRIIWEPAGLVYERIPENRISMRWLTRRSYRHGITLARCDSLIYRSPWKQVLRATRGAAQIPIGAAETVLGYLRKNESWRRGLVRASRGVGVLAGVAGAQFDEYRR